MYSEQYKDYKWIKVKRFQDDASLSWEERFKLLEKHHLEETMFLIDKVRDLAKQLDENQVANSTEVFNADAIT